MKGNTINDNWLKGMTYCRCFGQSSQIVKVQQKHFWPSLHNTLSITDLSDIFVVDFLECFLYIRVVKIQIHY